MIDSHNNELYGIGSNRYGSIGLGRSTEKVHELTKVHFKDQSDMQNKYKLDLVNIGRSSRFGFALFTNTDDSADQIIYSFGDNAYGQQGFESNDNFEPVQSLPLMHLLKNSQSNNFNTETYSFRK